MRGASARARCGPSPRAFYVDRQDLATRISRRQDVFVPVLPCRCPRSLRCLLRRECRVSCCVTTATRPIPAALGHCCRHCHGPDVCCLPVPYCRGGSSWDGDCWSHNLLSVPRSTRTPNAACVLRLRGTGGQGVQSTLAVRCHSPRRGNGPRTPERGQDFVGPPCWAGGASCCGWPADALGSIIVQQGKEKALFRFVRQLS